MVEPTDLSTTYFRSLVPVRSTSPTRCRAFTLIELLAVVAVLLVLTALLMPALSKARRQARTATCLSNLRQLHEAFDAYVAQNAGRSIAESDDHQLAWTRVLRPLLAAGSDPWLCPEANLPSYGWGSARLAWGPADASRGTPLSLNFLGAESSSYGFNGWLYYKPGDEDHYRFHGRHGGRIPILADANWMDAFARQTDALPSNADRGAGPTEPELGRFYLDRHDRSVNVGFLDGHAEQMALEDLTSLRWSRTRYFQPPLTPATTMP